MNGMSLQQGHPGSGVPHPATGWHAPTPAVAGQQYPQVPPPVGAGYHAVPPGYPAAQQSVGYTQPPAPTPVPAPGWAASTGAKPEHAQPGSSMAGHYGHLQ